MNFHWLTPIYVIIKFFLSEAFFFSILFCFSVLILCEDMMCMCTHTLGRCQFLRGGLLFVTDCIYCKSVPVTVCSNLHFPLIICPNKVYFIPLLTICVMNGVCSFWVFFLHHCNGTFCQHKPVVFLLTSWSLPHTHCLLMCLNLHLFLLFLCQVVIF